MLRSQDSLGKGST